MVLFGSRLLSQQTFSPRYYLSSGLCLMGLSALFLTQGQEQPRMEYWLGYLFATGCAVSWTFYSLSVRHGKGINDSLNTKVCLVGFLMSFCIHLGFETFQLPSIAALLGIVFSGSGVIALAYLSWEKGMKGGNVTILTTFSYSVPILSIALLVLFDLTELTWNLFFATILIAIAGCFSMVQKITFKWPARIMSSIVAWKI